MSNLKRNPVNWPRMKPRGARVKALLSMRRLELIVIPHARPELMPDGSMQFHVSNVGGMRMEFRRWYDGYDRRASRPKHG